MKIIVKFEVIICDGFSLFFFSVQRLIVIGNGKAKWDSDAGGVIRYENDNTVEKAFSTTAGTSGYGCAGWSASANDWMKPWPIMIWYEFSSTHIPARFSFRQVTSDQGPKKWSFVGSTEEGCTHGSIWKPLCGIN